MSLTRSLQPQLHVQRTTVSYEADDDPVPKLLTSAVRTYERCHFDCSADAVWVRAGTVNRLADTEHGTSRRFRHIDCFRLSSLSTGQSASW
jgi:hypothetical protein